MCHNAFDWVKKFTEDTPLHFITVLIFINIYMLKALTKKVSISCLKLFNGNISVFVRLNITHNMCNSEISIA